jgi:hypothetical protein
MNNAMQNFLAMELISFKAFYNSYKPEEIEIIIKMILTRQCMVYLFILLGEIPK